MSIGVGITTRNRRQDAMKCITQLLRYTIAEKVVIVDDNSEEPFTCNDPRVTLLYNVNRQGVAKSKNTCIRELNGFTDIFLFDDDCYPKMGGFESAYIQTAKALNYPALNFTWDSRSNGTEIYYHRVIDREESEGYRVKIHENPHGSMIYLSREAIDAIGGFDEDYGIYGAEHSDLFRRLHNLGKVRKIYPDLESSSKFIETLDRDNSASRSSLSLEERLEALKIAEKVAKENIDSKKFIRI